MFFSSYSVLGLSVKRAISVVSQSNFIFLSENTRTKKKKIISKQVGNRVLMYVNVLFPCCPPPSFSWVSLFARTCNYCTSCEKKLLPGRRQRNLHNFALLLLPGIESPWQQAEERNNYEIKKRKVQKWRREENASHLSVLSDCISHKTHKPRRSPH